MIKLYSILSLCLLMLSTFTYADSFCSNKDLEKLPILQGGRVKPLYVHASETIRFITGKSKVEGLDSVHIYCLLSLKKTAPDIFVRIDHKDSKKFFALGKDEGRISIKKLVDMQQKIALELRGVKQTSAYGKELQKTLSKIEIYKDVVAGQNWKVPLVAKKVNWIPITIFLKKEGNNLSSAGKDYINKKGATHLLELKYAKYRPFSIAMIFVFLGIFFNILLKGSKVALGFSLLAISMETAAMVVRVLISGRAPITNMYESVMFSGFGALILALIIGHYKKDKIFITVGLSYNVCCLMMMTFANNMLDPSIAPLVPVLRDNFWLSTHVTTIMLSYGALALSWILANIVMVRRYFTRLEKRELKYYSDLIYSCLKYGIILLSAGIILGGIWADYSWGRFWGWDPKETWSLIVLCIYMIILHGKRTSWIPPQRFIPTVAGAFLSVMFAWFGVNYILASGLHAYGFSEGGALFLLVFFVIQVLLIVVSKFKVV